MIVQVTLTPSKADTSDARVQTVGSSIPSVSGVVGEAEPASR